MHKIECMMKLFCILILLNVFFFDSKQHEKKDFTNSEREKQFPFELMNRKSILIYKYFFSYHRFFLLLFMN